MLNLDSCKWLNWGQWNSSWGERRTYVVLLNEESSEIMSYECWSWDSPPSSLSSAHVGFWNCWVCIIYILIFVPGSTNQQQIAQILKGNGIPYFVVSVFTIKSNVPHSISYLLRRINEDKMASGRTSGSQAPQHLQIWQIKMLICEGGPIV